MQMRVLCAPDSFKEVIGSGDAARAIARGVHRGGNTSDVCPIADGGEGTLDVLIGSRNGCIHTHTVTGPTGAAVEARLGIIDGGSSGRCFGIIELAEASGLALVPPDQRDPTRTTTAGVGELMARAIEDGANHLIVGLGGSSSVDGGLGLSSSFGAIFYDAHDQPLTGVLTGWHLDQIHRIRPASPRCPIDVLCDVENPLCGPDGAAAVYGPQKGATPKQVASLDRGLAHLAAITEQVDTHFGQPASQPQPLDTHFAGAAGGAAFGLQAFCGGDLHRGTDYIFSWIDLDSRLRAADLIITGEGRLDAQSMRGKAVGALGERAGESGCPIFAIVGSLGEGWEACLKSNGGQLDRVECLVSRFGGQAARRDTARLLEVVASELVG